jgi:hypothetical protein
MIYLRTIIFVLVSVILLTSFGCSKGNNRGTIPVTVTVKYKGVTIHNAVVVFHAEKNFANGLTDKSGFVKMSTFKPEDGVMPDEYKVTIAKEQVVEELDPNLPIGSNVISSKTVFHIPQKYNDTSTSGLTANVVKGQNNDYVFDLIDD